MNIDRTLCLALALVTFAATGFAHEQQAGTVPTIVSPVRSTADRCPTFSWSAVPAAEGYQLVVYRVGEEIEESPILEMRFPAGATAWTPPGAECLVPGARYAWTVRVPGKGAGEWSDPVLFEVATGPSVGEVEAAIVTLREYLATQDDERQPGELLLGESELGLRGERAVAEGRYGLSAPRPGGGVKSAGLPTPGGDALTSDTDGLTSMPAPAVPSLGAPSLTVTSNIALGSSSNLFKDGSVFLWDDTTGNTALGRLALSLAAGTATRNTAVGRDALRFTTQGPYPANGSYNTALGDSALRLNLTGNQNTAIGFEAMRNNTLGYGNTGVGLRALYSNSTGRANTGMGLALFSNTTGSYNTAVGAGALFENTGGDSNTATGRSALSQNTTGGGNTAFGSSALSANTTGNFNTAIGGSAGGAAPSDASNNIFIASPGDASDSTPTIRIGTQGTQTRAFLAGVSGSTVSGSTVLVASDGQLGVASSSRRFKEEIADLGDISERVFDLRPVTFRYRPEVLPEGGPQIGLIAEEVAELFPELVATDTEGRPSSVRYDLLSVLLLDEVQRLEERVEELERGSSATSRRPWWRRFLRRDRTVGPQERED